MAGAAVIAIGVHQGLVGVGAVAARRWRRLAVAPAATGFVVLFYTLRAVLHYALEPGLYVEVTTYGAPTRFVLGAEPILLVAGGLLLVGAGVVGWRGADPDGAEDGETPRAPSTR
nr:hypothetical protein [Haloplanus natans]